MPKEIGGFKKIDSINMDNNDLKKIPLEVSLLTTLRHFSLRYNKLRSKNIENVYQIKSLWSLGLDNNKIDVISKRVKNLSGLKYLGVTTNPIIDLPQEFAKLKKLEILGFNDLKTFNWERVFLLIKDMPQLRAVGMSEMGLERMPNGFEKLTRVQSFWLGNNSFNKIEQERIKSLLPNADIEF